MGKVERQRRGARALVRTPVEADELRLLELSKASRAHLHPWTHNAPTSSDAYGRMLENAQREDHETFLVCRSDDDDPVGIINASQIFHGNFKNTYLGYYAFAEHAGRGFMRDGLGLVLDELFGPLDLHRAEANIQPGNERSIALVRSLGFRKEGFSPRYLKLGSRWLDHERWAMLAEDWSELRRADGEGAPAVERPA